MRYIGCIVSILLAFALVGCAVNPVTGQKEVMLISEAQELELGKNSDPDIRWQFGGVYHDEKLASYVDEVGQRTAAVSHRTNIPYHFTVVDSSVANAFALPGGYIYITRGLLTMLDNEAQLAAVLGHEIGHVNARHSAKRLTSILGFNMLLAVVDQVASGGENYQKWRGLIMLTSNAAFATVSLGYSRENEFQADELGESYSHKAGYSSEGMIQLLEVLKGMHDREPSSVEEFFSSHPRTSARIAAVQKQIAQIPPEQSKGQLNQGEFKAKTRDLLTAQKAYDRCDAGEKYRADGKYNEALSEYKAALQIRRNLAEPHHGMGLVYYAQGKYSDAVKEYKSAVRIDPEYIFSYNGMGIAYIKLGRDKDAVPVLQKAVQIYENYSDAHANLGEAYYNLKQYPEAIESLEMAVSINPEHPRAYTNLGLTYEATGNTTKAIEAYEKAIQGAPNESYTETARQRLAKIKEVS